MSFSTAKSYAEARRLFTRVAREKFGTLAPLDRVSGAARLLLDLHRHTVAGRRPAVAKARLLGWISKLWGELGEFETRHRQSPPVNSTPGMDREKRGAK